MNEDKTTEWKESWRDEYLKWICGFANAQGGILEIGRNDKGQIVGVPKAQKLLEDLPNKIRDILGIIPEIDHIKKRGKSLIIVQIKPYKHPINYKGSFYYRSGSTNQELRGPALHHFLLNKTGQTWDGVAVPNSSLSALDAKVISEFKEKAVEGNRLPVKVMKETHKTLMEKQLKLTEGRSLKRSAVLLFHPDPEMYVTGAYIKLGYFQSETEVRYHDEIHGDLFTQVKKTMELLLTKYLKAFISYKGLYRKEQYPVPASALREALLNAIIHRDYSTGGPIQIRVYDHKIMFWNTCRLPEGWTVKNMKSKHQSRPHNPDIAKTFFLANMIETWGRGIRKMQEDCKAHGTAGPKIWGYKTDICVEFKNHESDIKSKILPPQTPHNMREKTREKVTGKTREKTREKVTGKTRGKTREKVTGKTREKTREKVTGKTREKTRGKTREKILYFITYHSKITIQELAYKTGLSIKGVEWQIQKLKKAGYLKRVGPAKGGYWQIIIKNTKKDS